MRIFYMLRKSSRKYNLITSSSKKTVFASSGRKLSSDIIINNQLEKLSNQELQLPNLIHLWNTYYKTQIYRF